MVPITEHNELPDVFESHGWAFDLEEDGDLEYIDNAIAAWQEWRQFVLKRQANEGQEPLF